MTAESALHKFWSGFGIKAYPTTAVPDDAVFPWLTYEVQTGFFGDGDLNVSVSLWFYTESEKIPNDKVREIGEVIGRGGVQIPYDEGVIWIKRGSPWCNNLVDETDRSIKRRELNVSLEYL